MENEIKAFADLNSSKYWDVGGMTQEELCRSFQTLDEKMNIIYQFVLGYNDYINMRHNYTSEVELTMLEAHVLTDICDHPGSTVTSLAAKWDRSVSATSQTVRRLMAKGLVTRENAPDNGKVFYLHPTEKGLWASDQHKRYDVEDTVKTVKSLLHDLSFEEVETMFHSLERYVELLRKGAEKSK